MSRRQPSKYGGDRDGRFIACRHLCRPCCLGDVDLHVRLVHEGAGLVKHAAAFDWSQWSDARGTQLEEAWRGAARSAREHLSGEAIEQEEAAADSCKRHGFHFAARPSPREDMLGRGCAAECDHRCATQNREARLSNGEAVVQYWGRWSFERVGGMTEPGSAIASLLHLTWPLLFLVRRWRRPRPRPHCALSRHFEWNALQGCLAWAGSFVYHAHGVDLTSRVDLTVALGTTVSPTPIEPTRPGPHVTLMLTRPGPYGVHARQAASAPPHADSLACLLAC